MTEYRGFKYKYKGENKYLLQYPPGYKAEVRAESVDALHAIIDAIIAMVKP